MQSAHNKLFKTICRKTGVTIRDHGLIQENDHVLVGISGGKDSMILLEVLHERRRALPFDFRITAAHVHLNNVGYSSDAELLNAFCSGLDIPLVIRAQNLDLESGPSRGICFLCSWHRRKLLFDLSKELGCNKLAMGHHRNDAVETLLINMIHHGSISALPYRLSMFNGRLELIRPLLDLEEKQLIDYAGRRNFRTESRACPHESNNRRTEIRSLMREIETLHGKGIYHIFKSMGHIFPEYLPGKKARIS